MRRVFQPWSQLIKTHTHLFSSLWDICFLLCRQIMNCLTAAPVQVLWHVLTCFHTYTPLENLCWFSHTPTLTRTERVLPCQRPHSELSYDKCGTAGCWSDYFSGWVTGGWGNIQNIHSLCFPCHCEWRAVTFSARPVTASQKRCWEKIKMEEERMDAL